MASVSDLLETRIPSLNGMIHKYDAVPMTSLDHVMASQSKAHML